MIDEDSCVAEYATRPPLPSSSDYGVVGAKPAHRPPADQAYKEYVYKLFYDSDGSATCATVHELAESKFNKGYSFALILKLRAEMNRERWWRHYEPKRNVVKEGYPWETRNDT